jgi:hypothetical protein
MPCILAAARLYIYPSLWSVPQQDVSSFSFCISCIKNENRACYLVGAGHTFVEKWRLSRLDGTKDWLVPEGIPGSLPFGFQMLVCITIVGGVLKCSKTWWLELMTDIKRCPSERAPHYGMFHITLMSPEEIQVVAFECHLSCQSTLPNASKSAFSPTHTSFSVLLP